MTSDETLSRLMASVRGSLPVGIFGIVAQDHDGAILAWTRSAEDLLNMTGDQMAGRSSLDPVWSTVTVDGDPLVGDDHPAMTTLRTGAPVVDRIIGVRRGHSADLEYMWMVVDSYPLSAAHHPFAVVTCFRSVEPELSGRLALQHSERLFRMITERMHEVVGLHALDGTWLWASPATLTMFGRTPDELIGTDTFAMIEDGYSGVAREALQSILEGRGPVTIVLPFRHKDGHIVWAEVIGQLIRDPAGRPYQCQSSLRDVTERVAAESERDAAVEVFTSILRTSPTGMLLVDPNGSIRQANAAMHTMLGLPDGTLTDRVSILDLVHPDSRADTARDRAQIVRGRRESMRWESRMRTPTLPEPIWVESVTVLIRDGSDTVTAVLEQITDITSHKTAYAELSRLATRDPLTGLLNREAFMATATDALRDADANGHRIAFAFMDIDKFKSINDTWGHHIGDVALVAIARRLTAVLDGRGWACRYGGDEFAVAYRSAHTDPQLTDLLSAVFTEPFELDDTVTVTISASIGTARGSSDDPAALVRDADSAMYQVKSERDIGS